MAETTTCWLQHQGLCNEWATISNSPISFTIAVALATAIVCGFIWRAVKWRYEGIIDNSNSTIEKLREQIEERAEPAEPLAPTTPRSPDERSADYDPRWEKVTTFALWQAAWLWVGQEPKPQVTPGTPAYPAFQMLKSACRDGSLHYMYNALHSRGKPEPNIWTMVSREDLKKLAALKLEAPDFLQ